MTWDTTACIQKRLTLLENRISLLLKLQQSYNAARSSVVVITKNGEPPIIRFVSDRTLKMLKCIFECFDEINEKGA